MHDMDPIIEVARKYDLRVIEDATESLGARYRGRRIGTLGDIACFSFNGNKIITTGGGGMVVTDNEDWARKVRYLTTQAKDDPIEYIHNEIGYNYRLTNIHAAMGCAQLEQLERYITIKRRIAGDYERGLADVPGLTLMKQAKWADSIYWLYTVLVDEESFGRDSRALLEYLGKHKVQTRPLWQPLHRSPAHQGSFAYKVSVAEEIHRQALCLPCSVGLTHEEVERVLETILQLVKWPLHKDE